MPGSAAVGARLKTGFGRRTAFPAAFFAFFFVSGFCSLIYEVVWLRLAMASFGVNAPLVAIFLSVFMAGLGLGSWAAGRVAERLRSRGRAFFLRLYAAVELATGASAFAVPFLFKRAEALLAGGFGAVSWSSPAYFAVSGALVALALLPWCTLMGATFPFAMAALPEGADFASERSFSHLYVANVAGAASGALFSAFVLIEALGLRGTLRVAAAGNALIAAWAALAGRGGALAASAPPPSARGRALLMAKGPLACLFVTGLTSMGMEMVWVRVYAKFMQNSIYAFALILAVYLAATFLGSRVYRAFAARPPAGDAGPVWAAAGIFGLLPLVSASQDLLEYPPSLARGLLLVAVGIAPFCAAIGFLTPKLVDDCSAGDPRRAGGAYAVNILGCIAGPLLAGFALLPRFDESVVLALLALPLMAAGFVLVIIPALRARRPAGSARSAGLVLLIFAGFVPAFLYGRAHNRFPGRVARDYEAVVRADGEGAERQLFVNGIGMTKLTPITKFMAHLPMALLSRRPRNSLNICLGMGTTFRSLLSWGVPSTVVELVPSVPGFLPFFHPDAPEMLRAQGAAVVIDDGRRFLRRTRETYDVISIDPAPPLTGAYASALFTREFYALAKTHLEPGGILHQWISGDVDPDIRYSMAKSLAEEFPYVRIFPSVAQWGVHLVASDRPIVVRRPGELARRMPAAARRDFVEWGPSSSAEKQFKSVLEAEIPLSTWAERFPEVPALSDDLPYNEYFWLRGHFPALAGALARLRAR